MPRPTIFRAAVLVASSAGLASAHAGTATTVESGTWYQIAHPGDTGASTVGAMFPATLDPAGYGDTWTVYLFDGPAQAYRQPALEAPIPTGAAFWFIQATGQPVELSSDGLPHALGRQRGDCPSEHGCTSINLADASEGNVWNMVGNPFDAPVDLELSRVRTQAAASSCETGCSLEQANAREVLRPQLWSYDGEADRYVDYARADLPTWGAIWMAVNTDGTDARPLLLLPDPFCS